MSLRIREDHGILVPLSQYRKLKAFQHGGYFWDQQPQNLVRQYLGEILPPAELVDDSNESCGLFRRFADGKEVISRSRKVGRFGVPKKELSKLAQAVDAMKRAAEHPDTQPNNRMLLKNFRLPNPEQDPDLYRLSGPLWKKRLHIIWGCEQSHDSSIAPEQVASTLKTDHLHFLRLMLFWIGILGILAALIWMMMRIAPAVETQAAYIADKAPTAGVVVGSHDNPGRTVSLDLGGSTDPDGQIKEHQIDWGDGTTELLPEGVNTASKTYDKDGNYPVKIRAIDEKGKASKPVSLLATFDHEAQMRAEEAKRAEELAEKQRIATEEANRAAERKLLVEAREKAERQAEEAARAKAAMEAVKRQRDADELARNKKAAEASVNSTEPTQNNGTLSFQDTVTGKPIKPIKFTRPDYPRKAIYEGIEGFVTVEFVVNTSGKVKDIKVIDSKNGSYFKPPVLLSLNKTEFSPLLIDGQPTEQRVRRTFTFVIAK
jgi:TonB family protein